MTNCQVLDTVTAWAWSPGRLAVMADGAVAVGIEGRPAAEAEEDHLACVVRDLSLASGFVSLALADEPGGLHHLVLGPDVDEDDACEWAAGRLDELPDELAADVRAAGLRLAWLRTPGMQSTVSCGPQDIFVHGDHDTVAGVRWALERRFAVAS